MERKRALAELESSTDSTQRLRPYVMAFTEELYEDMTLSSTALALSLRWSPAACRGNLLNGPVAIHHTCGHSSFVGSWVYPRASRIGPVTASHSHSRAAGLPRSPA